MTEADRYFYIHNRVESIYTAKANLERIVPDVSIAVAHGQMKPKELETVMHDFMYKKYDVLIVTTIVENGVDIPNVNTLIVNRADSFGVSQLYQLRGRIGRSHRQAYCYFLTKNSADITDVARKRLDTLTEFTDLGSGFQIAMRDLEIRGAGNLLGQEQSGFIENVGFDLYTKILEEAVQELKASEFNEVLKNADIPKRIYKSAINLKTRMFIPENYVSDDSERVELYRRLMECNKTEEIDDIKSELQDRFGKEPKEVGNLLENLYLSIVAGRLFIKNIALNMSGTSWFLKFIFDSVELEILDNTETALLLQDNLLKLKNSGSIQMKLENDGEIVYFYPERGENKLEFCKKCIKDLAINE